jgi:predicted regulator of Ras-like GTPase activity (Roadblock/LC7/MglB family)
MLRRFWCFFVSGLVVSMVILEADHEVLVGLLETILAESNAGYVFLVDKSGPQIASAGEMEIDTTSLASLTAGAVAATEGLSSLIGETRFTTLFHEGADKSLHITQVGEKAILLTVFSQESSLGLVRLRTQQHLPALEKAFSEVLNRDQNGGPTSTISSSAFAEISDEDIDALFG